MAQYVFENIGGESGVRKYSTFSHNESGERNDTAAINAAQAKVKHAGLDYLKVSYLPPKGRDLIPVAFVHAGQVEKLKGFE